VAATRISDEIPCARENRIDAIEDEAAGGGVDEVDHVGELAAKFVKGVMKVWFSLVKMA
jgi:hypothetical protein